MPWGSSRTRLPSARRVLAFPEFSAERKCRVAPERPVESRNKGCGAEVEEIRRMEGAPGVYLGQGGTRLEDIKDQ